jgi:hypothetical protein
MAWRFADDHHPVRACGGCEAGMFMLDCVAALQLSGFVPPCPTAEPSKCDWGARCLSGAMQLIAQGHMVLFFFGGSAQRERATYCTLTQSACGWAIAFLEERPRRFLTIAARPRSLYNVHTQYQIISLISAFKFRARYPQPVSAVRPLT